MNLRKTYVNLMRSLEERRRFLFSGKINKSKKVLSEIRKINGQINKIQARQYNQFIQGFKKKNPVNRQIELRELGKIGLLRLEGIKPSPSDFKRRIPHKKYSHN